MENDPKQPEPSEEDFSEYEAELVTDATSILEHTSMALCAYNPALAKQALALVLGTLVADFEEGPCIHKIIGLIEEKAAEGGMEAEAKA
jgi:hypothetical protein